MMVKKRLEVVQHQKHTLLPKNCMQYEKENLEREVLSLHANLLNKKRSLKGVQFDLVKLETKLKEAK